MRLTEQEYEALVARSTKQSAPVSSASLHAIATTALASGATFTVPGDPIGKPRQTRADKWKKRPAVLRYREWADAARAAAPALPESPAKVTVYAYVGLPKSYSQKKRAALAGMPHRAKPDADNILKSVCDALFPEDSMIWEKHIVKRWDDGNGPRVEITVEAA